MAHRWTGSHAYRDHANDRVIDPGEQLPDDIAERVAAAHPHQVEAIETSDDGEATPPFETSELTVDEIEEAVADVDDVELIERVREDEASGKDRDTALEAIDERLDELDA